MKISNSCRNTYKFIYIRHFCCNNYSREETFCRNTVYKIDKFIQIQIDFSLQIAKSKRSCTISDNDSQGRLIDTDKWDNHNTIARGWAGSRAEDRIDLGGSEDHYQPVTFRKLYGTKSVAGPSTTPLPMSSKPVVSEQETYSPNDEGYADL